ncbi:MAG: EAL domain-containing protein, partial [Gammaproteobacteria bacterium]|nr:EAL domain-containing protein [Gammaproteobacteria bacterium]
EHRMLRKDGRLLHVHQQGKVELDRRGNVTRIIGTLQDTTARRMAEEQMRKLSGAVEQIADSVMITDSNGIIEYVNPAFESMTGYAQDEIIGKTPRVIKSDRQSDAFYKRLWRTISNGEVFSDVIVNCKKSGEIYYEEKTITPQKDRHGKIVHYISTGKDVTERIEAQERLYHLAHHDSLTGLPNRVLLQDRLAQAIARIRWHERSIAVMFMDLDRFKMINDTLGHAIGDQLLQYVARRLHECVREGDTVARLGGDEFAIVLNDLAALDDVPHIAEKLIESLSEPLVINGQELFITSSIGIAMFPQDGTDSQELLKKADAAMYRAKARGKDNYQFYTVEDDHQASERLSIETRLRRALEKDEFRLNYQPQLSLRDGGIIGCEALLRWHNDELKNISPMQFIPILEETGMINAVGDWVLQTACAQNKAWQDLGLQTGRIAVNLSIRQFQSRGLVNRINDILSQTGLAPGQLELEITEGLLIEQITETAKILNELHEMGICLSIDDFGTGYSSMNYLKRLPFDTLKIDRIFVRDVTFNPDDAAIAAAIITLGHTLGMEIVAEGVETAEQLNYLFDQQCDAIQGYLYSPPLTAEALISLAQSSGVPSFMNAIKSK